MRQIALVCFALALGCSINKRSDGFACTATSDCDTGRVCQSGFCVVPGGSGSNVPGDAPRGSNTPDAPRTNDGGQQCPSICTSCDTVTKTCDINCEQESGSACDQNITCPEGYTCSIECTTQGACRQNIDCTKAAACSLTCSTAGACANVQCGSGACTLMCTGSHSCGEVDCSNSCACDATCGGAASACTGMFQCPTNSFNEECVGINGGCSSTFDPGCNTCQ